jgi:transcriptional regulator with XRE-family HTH domain
LGQPAFGVLLRGLREERKLSLRELAQLAGIDHAYVHRLETGAKAAPSEVMIGKIVRALKAQKREAGMLRYLAIHGEADPLLVAHALADTSVTIAEFATAVGATYGGTGKRNYKVLISRIRALLKEEN